MTKKPNKSGNFRRAAATQPASLSTTAPRAAGATPPEGSGAVGVQLSLPKPKKIAPPSSAAAKRADTLAGLPLAEKRRSVGDTSTVSNRPRGGPTGPLRDNEASWRKAPTKPPKKSQAEREAEMFALLDDEELDIMLRSTIATLVGAQGAYERLRAEKSAARADWEACVRSNPRGARRRAGPPGAAARDEGQAMTPERAKEHIEAWADDIYVREQVDGKWGRCALSVLPLIMAMRQTATMMYVSAARLFLACTCA